MEFLCDWRLAAILVSKLSALTAEANARSAARFINGPGYSCGSFRPWVTGKIEIGVMKDAA
jgi:hypothetical protein